MPGVGLPKQASIAGGDPGHPTAATVNILMLAGKLSGYNGRMCHFPIAQIRCFPEKFAGREFHGNEERIAAGPEDDPVAVHERTLAGIPLRNFGVKFLGEIEPHWNWPVRASRQMTWHFGPSATT